MEINVTELQILNQGNQLNRGTAEGVSREMGSSSPAFASYLSRETESFQKHSNSIKEDNTIRTDAHRTESNKDINEEKTSTGKTDDQRNSTVQENSRTESNELPQNENDSQNIDYSVDNGSENKDGGEQVNSEVSDDSPINDDTMNDEMPTEVTGKTKTEDNSETVEMNMVSAQQVPDETIVIDTKPVQVSGDSESEIQPDLSAKEMRIFQGSQHDDKDRNTIEVEADAVDSDIDLQADIDEMMTEEEQLIEEQINGEDTDQEGLDIEDTLKTSLEDNNGDPESGTDNEEEVHYENHMSDKENGHRQNHEKSGYKNNVIEAAQAVKDNVKPEVADESEGIHALNKNIKEMIHRHSVTGSSELKGGSLMQAAVETETGMTHTVTNSADIASMSRTADSQMLASVNRPAGIAELLDSIVYAAKGNNRLGVTIEHSELGKLNINLSLDKGNVHVNIHAADKATKEIIENNIQYIIDSLEKEGVSIGGFSVGMKDYQGKMFQAMLNGNGNRKEFNENVKNADISNGLVSVFA